MSTWELKIKRKWLLQDIKRWVLRILIIGVAFKSVQLILIFTFLQGYYTGCKDGPKVIDKVSALHEYQNDSVKVRSDHLMDQCAAETRALWDSN